MPLRTRRDLRRLAIHGTTLLFLLLGSLGCSNKGRYDQAIGILIDVSGTYADQKTETVNLIKRDILPTLIPGDTLFVIRIDSQSYDKENIVAFLTLDQRPSQANAQKLALAQKLDHFATTRDKANHTDIPGAIMLASEHLKEIGAGSNVLLVFSDMQTDLPKGSKRTFEDDELTGAHVAAVNIKRLKKDTRDPEKFRKRLATWEDRLKNAGAAEWRTFLDPAKLPDYLSDVRA